MPNAPAHKQQTAPAQRRISAKVRHALTARVKDGLTWIEAAKAAGLSEAGIHKARKSQHVKALYEEIKGEYIQEVDALKAPFKAQALLVARDLMRESKSDAVKARMVEFLAGEGKGNAVNVAVQVNNHMANGYEYVRPGAQIVDITPAPDSPSSDRDE